jgi:hypothetical protein
LVISVPFLLSAVNFSFLHETTMLDQLLPAELASQKVTIPAGKGWFLLRQTMGHNQGAYSGTGSKLALSFMVFYYNLDCRDEITVVGGR